MTTDDYTAIIERLFEGVWNGADPAVVEEYVGADYYIHDRELAEELRGPELYRALAEATREMFPDMAFTVHDAVTEGEEVAVRWTMTGTHEGRGYGLEPTGKEVELDAIEINRFEDGELVETWTQSDVLGLMRQMGAIPPE